MELTVKDSKDIAELISAFLVVPLPVYLVENYISSGDSIKLCAWIKGELKEGINYHPIDILEKVVENFKDDSAKF